MRLGHFTASVLALGRQLDVPRIVQAEGVQHDRRQARVMSGQAEVGRVQMVAQAGLGPQRRVAGQDQQQLVERDRFRRQRHALGEQPVAIDDAADATARAVVLPSDAVHSGDADRSPAPFGLAVPPRQPPGRAARQVDVLVSPDDQAMAGAGQAHVQAGGCVRAAVEREHLVR